MSKIPTAEEFWELSLSHGNRAAQIEDLKRFAKLHVEAALKAAAENAKITIQTYGHPDMSEWDKVVNRQSILSAYPLENIQSPLWSRKRRSYFPISSKNYE